MNKNNPSLTFCTTGGCTAKLGAAVLEKILPMLPKKEDKNLLVGFGSSDDAAVYRLSDNMALVQTLDFFLRWWRIRIHSVKSRQQMP